MVWNSAVDLGGQTEGKRPQIIGNERVAMLGIHKHGAGAMSQVLNPPLGNPILVMSTDTAEGDGLIRVVQCSMESPGSRMPLLVEFLVFHHSLC
jgi:hypothetical protein